MADFLPWIADELADLAARGLLRNRRVVTRRGGGWCEVDGRRLRDFASNDYLDLACDPRVIAAASRAAEEYGAGSGASALVVGRSPIHEKLESALAAFERREAALLFPTGFAANMGTLAALAGKGDVIFSDRRNHASLIDGCRLSGATVVIYDHDRLDRLGEGLVSALSARRRYIVTDGLFSMDGMLAPLSELCGLAERHDAALLVDEAHATGVFGKEGRGAGEHFHVEEHIAVRVGTLSKALGSMGGFVAGNASLIEYLWNSARPQVFSTALPPGACGAAIESLAIVEGEPQRRAHLLDISRRLRQGVVRIGHDTIAGGEGPIVPVLFGDPRTAVEVSKRCEAAGLFVPAIRPPSVPVDSSRLRISLSAAHNSADVDRLLDVLQSFPPRR